MWSIGMCLEFMVEFEHLAEEVQDELLSQLHLLERRDPALGRPRVDTLEWFEAFEHERAAFLC